ncbi:glycosyltransferase 61 family protein [Falsihalocynthiibacter sp. S25ZX9]|uniref:glycosyltransferase 61 family protein n=1 Tax=Falsihalocynthiibacter sp. S25ZX9 TaxID=3240870 RepID=UPI003510B30E
MDLRSPDSQDFDLKMQGEGSEAAQNLPRKLNLLLLGAMDAVVDPASRAQVFLSKIDTACGEFAAQLRDEYTVAPKRVSFDKQTNVYLVTEVYQTGGHRTLLRQLIAARPRERHIVLFTGTFENKRDFGLQEVVEAGGFPIYPDKTLGLFDRLLWLRDKLASFTARRLFTLHHPEDVLAAIALCDFDRPNTYVVHHADTTASAGVDLAAAKHLAIRPEQQKRIQEMRPDREVYSFPLAFNPEHIKLRNKTARARLVSKSKGIARVLLRRPRVFPRAGAFMTATCGGSHKFNLDGPLGLPETIVRILRATGGQHVHIGPVTDALKTCLKQALLAAQIPPENLSIVGEVPSVAQELIANTVDLFISSFPVGGGLTIVEAAYLGIPVAIYGGGSDEVSHYLSGATHAPSDTLDWITAQELEDKLRALMSDTPDVVSSVASDAPKYIARSNLGKPTKARLGRMAVSSRQWFVSNGSPEKFSRRLNAIIGLCEGRHRAPLNVPRDQIIAMLFDPEYYLRRYPDIATAGVDPLQHFLSNGENELRSPNPLFDANYYLSNLTVQERKSAAAAPLMHYVLRGEAQGYFPHPLFDPAFCKVSIEETGAGDPVKGNILAQYLQRSDQIAPHMFFDPRYYVRQMRLPVKGQPLLAHFLESGIQKGTCPHPLLHPAWLSHDPEVRPGALLQFLTHQEMGRDQAKVSGLFEPAYFCKDQDLARYILAAPNSLWAHLIEGNQIGRDPHLLISVEHVVRSRPDTLRTQETIVQLVATNKLSTDTHPLVQRSHILTQAPYAANIHGSILEFFLTNGASFAIDPHPNFSTQYYLTQYPDVHEPGGNPLEHYLSFGQFEGRLPHPMFEGNAEFETAQADSSQASPLLWLLSQGTPHFHSAPHGSLGIPTLGREAAIRFFRLGQDKESASLLYSSLHHASGGVHPTLITEVVPFSVDPTDASETIEIYPQEAVTLPRPSVASHTHIAPSNGQYLAPAATASIYSHATLVAGNDGFLTDFGTWVDHGLLNFDVEKMCVKESGAVVAVEQNRILLRRYSSEMIVEDGIFASGTYSHNYFHFILEVIPRVMLACDIAPAHVPILTDAEMPFQHYQALRYFFPNREVVRLSRHVSVSVNKLYVGSMANIVSDYFNEGESRFDTVRYHPKIIQRLAKFGLSEGCLVGAKRLFLDNGSDDQRVANFPKVREALNQQGFENHTCVDLQFSELLRLFAQAGDIVGQSDAHLANMLFAPKGARVFALLSNTPGTNYYYWSALGECLGSHVVNIAGPRIKSSAIRGVQGFQSVYEDFFVPVPLVTPFFSKNTAEKRLEGPQMSAIDLLDDLLEANSNAGVLTSSWGLISKPTPEGFSDRLVAMRRQLLDRLQNASPDEVQDLLKHRFFTDYWANIWSGFIALQEHNADELAAIEDIKAYFSKASKQVAGDLAQEPEVNEEFARMLALAMVLVPTWKLPLVSDLRCLEPSVQDLYLMWLTALTYPYLEGEDAIYVAFATRLLDWLAVHLDESRPIKQREKIAEVASRLDLGQMFLIDLPFGDVLLARNRLLEHLAVVSDTPPRSTVRPMDMSQGRMRIGVLCRTFVKGPDSEAVVAFFKSFDRTKFEVFAYSMNFTDRVVASDNKFDELFDTVIDHRREFSSNAHGMRERLLADDLDVFLYANATTFGVGEPELALFHRIAPLQMTLNSHVPIAPGFASFDYCLTGLSDDPKFDISDAAHPERILRVEGPVINYINSLTPKATKAITRETLGLADDDVVMINAGACQKNRREFLLTMLRALVRVPKGKLLLAPYNPGWAGRSQAFAFNIQVAEAAKEVGVSLDRIIILSEMSVAEAETVLSLSDIYLSSFPHGGATMTHLSLIYGVPPVVLRRRSTRSIDQFLVGSLGFEKLLANTPDEYVELVGKLADDTAGRRKLGADIKAAAKHPVFVASEAFSKSMEKTVLNCLAEIEKRSIQIDTGEV